MKKILLILLTVALMDATVFAQDKLVSRDGQIGFFSHTIAEDISSQNFSVVSTFVPESGDVVYSVSMQSFEFEKALMQKHFNSVKFLDTKHFPKAKFKGKVTNVSEIDFATNGIYDASVEGELTIHGVTNKIAEKGTVTVSDDKIQIDTKMDVVLADYEVAFKKGKPSTNVAKTIAVTVKTVFAK